MIGLSDGADKQKFGEANWDDQIAMYTICAIAPVFLVQALYVPTTLLSSLSFPSSYFPFLDLLPLLILPSSKLVRV